MSMKAYRKDYKFFGVSGATSIPNVEYITAYDYLVRIDFYSHDDSVNLSITFPLEGMSSNDFDERMEWLDRNAKAQINKWFTGDITYETSEPILADVQEIAKALRMLNYWNKDWCECLACIAGLEEEYETADNPDYIEKIAKQLGVEIS